MNDSLSLSFTEAGKKMSNGVKSVVQSISSVIAVSTVFVLIGIMFFDIELVEIISIDFAMQSIIIVILYMVIHNALLNNGLRVGKKDEIYLAAHSEYEEMMKRIGEDTVGIDEFCDECVETEFVRAKKRLLINAGISYEKYQSEYEGKKWWQIKLPWVKRKWVVKANKLKRILLTPEMILLDDVSMSEREGMPLSRAEKLKRRIKTSMAMTVLFGCFTVSILLEYVEGINSAVVIYTFLKLVGLLWNGAKGYMTGISSFTEDAVEYLKVQVWYQARYIGWRDEFKAIKNPALTTGGGVLENVINDVRKVQG